MPTPPRFLRRNRPAAEHGTPPRRGQRIVVVAAVAASLGVAGAAAAGHTPWPDRSPGTATGAARNADADPSAPNAGDADPTAHTRGDVPAAPATDGTGVPGTDAPAAGGVATTEATSPAPSAGAPEPSTAPAADPPPATTDEVASAAGTESHEPTTTRPTVPPPTPAPAPTPSEIPTSVAPSEPTSTAAAPAPATDVTTAPTAPPAPATPPAPPTTDTYVPQTLSLSCAVEGTTVTCTFSGTAGTGYAGSLLLRGQLGGPGRVLLATTDTSATFVDAALAPGTYLYTAIAVDGNDHNLGHSNQISITIAG